jgi:hypothetical protein
MMNYQQRFVRDFDLPELKVSDVTSETEEPPVDLYLTVRQHDDVASIVLEGRLKTFDTAMVRSLLDDYVEICRQIGADPDRSLRS